MDKIRKGIRLAKAKAAKMEVEARKARAEQEKKDRRRIDSKVKMIVAGKKRNFREVEDMIYSYAITNKFSTNAVTKKRVTSWRKRIGQE